MLRLRSSPQESSHMNIQLLSFLTIILISSGCSGERSQEYRYPGGVPGDHILDLSPRGQGTTHFWVEKKEKKGNICRMQVSIYGQILSGEGGDILFKDYKDETQSGTSWAALEWNKQGYDRLWEPRDHKLFLWRKGSCPGEEEFRFVQVRAQKVPHGNYEIIFFY